MNAIAELIDPLASAAARAVQAGQPYRGALTPPEAWEVLQSIPDAILIDIRTETELELIGRLPAAANVVNVEWKRYPGWELNPGFLNAIRRKYGPDRILLLLCRSGIRSHEAALALAAAGYENVYQVLEGFEGELNAAGQRTRNGWKSHGLPWTQA